MRGKNQKENRPTRRGSSPAVTDRENSGSDDRGNRTGRGSSGFGRPEQDEPPMTRRGSG